VTVPKLRTVAVLVALTATALAGLAATGAGSQAAPARPAASLTSPRTLIAVGDSVTAGYGYYDNGTNWSPVHLEACKPSYATLNDRCSSNSALRAGQTIPTTPVYAPDWGYKADVSWAAQLAHRLGVPKSGFQNVAVTGSEPRHWIALAPNALQPDNGSLLPTLQKVEAADPDLIVLTMGANPLLSDFYLGNDHGCSLLKLPARQAQFDACVEGEFTNTFVAPRLTQMYSDILTNTTNSTVLVSGYHTVFPSGAVTRWQPEQLERVITLLNIKTLQTVAAVAQSNPAWKSRILYSEPPHFNIGYPGTGKDKSCGAHRPADGPSHQATVSQIAMVVRAGLSGGFCRGKAWIIGTDTGIHPARTGYTQFANAAYEALQSAAK
jgi:lysophospholipase L1-like esterase